MKITTEIDDNEIVELLKKIASIGRPFVAPQVASATTRLLMTREQYAERVSYSLRKVDALLPASAYVGTGRLRRVRVEIADAALLHALETGPVDEIAALATANARKSGAQK